MRPAAHARVRRPRPTETGSCKITRSVRVPQAARSARVRNNTLGDLDRRYNWEFTAGVQHQVMPRLAVGAMLFKRQIYEIPLTDRSFITTSDYTAFRRADAGRYLEGPGRRGGAGCQRDDHRVQPEPGEELGLRPGVDRPQRKRQPVALHGRRSVVLGSSPGRRHDVRQLDGGEERLGLLRIRRQPERAADRRPVSGPQRGAGRPFLRSAQLQHAVHCTSSSWRATTVCRSA